MGWLRGGLREADLHTGKIVIELQVGDVLPVGNDVFVPQEASNQRFQLNW